MSATVPPTTTKEIDEYLKDSTKQIYLVIGSDDSNAWAIALAAEQDNPPLLPIRFDKRDDAQKWIKDFNTIAALFDFKGKVRKLFNTTEVDDKDILYAEIEKARS